MKKRKTINVQFNLTLLNGLESIPSYSTLYSVSASKNSNSSIQNTHKVSIEPMGKRFFFQETLSRFCHFGVQCRTFKKTFQGKVYVQSGINHCFASSHFEKRAHFHVCFMMIRGNKARELVIRVLIVQHCCMCVCVWIIEWGECT